MNLFVEINLDNFDKKFIYFNTKAIKINSIEQPKVSIIFSDNNINKTYTTNQTPLIDKFFNYWITGSYIKSFSSEFRLQGMILNIWDFGTNDKLLLNVSMPSFTFARQEDGRILIPYQAVIIPAISGLLFLELNLCSSQEPKRDSLGRQISFPCSGVGMGEGIILALISITNFGIDFPITTGKHFITFSLKLNTDGFFVNKDSIRSAAFLEPKGGLHYIYENSIGAEFQYGYRFWVQPSLVNYKRPFWALSLLVPIKLKHN